MEINTRLRQAIRARLRQKLDRRHEQIAIARWRELRQKPRTARARPPGVGWLGSGQTGV